MYARKYYSSSDITDIAYMRKRTCHTRYNTILAICSCQNHILKQLDYEVNYNKKKMASISYIIDVRLNKRIHISFLCLYPE